MRIKRVLFVIKVNSCCMKKKLLFMLYCEIVVIMFELYIIIKLNLYSKIIVNISE